MPWKRTDPMLERAQFIAAVESGEHSFAECCRRFQISRKSGYKWWDRYQSEDVAGLVDRPPVAQHFAHALDAHTVADILAAKQAALRAAIEVSAATLASDQHDGRCAGPSRIGAIASPPRPGSTLRCSLGALPKH